MQSVFRAFILACIVFVFGCLLLVSDDFSRSIVVSDTLAATWEVSRDTIGDADAIPGSADSVNGASDRNTTGGIGDIPGGADPTTGWWGSGGAGVWGTDITSPGFMIDTGYFRLSSGDPYDEGADNITALIANIVNILLVAIATMAGLFIVIGGIILMASAGDSSRAGMAKSIITYNLLAIIMALLSYSIIQFVSWVLS